MYDELKDEGFVVITIALDKNAEDARPWIELAAPTHPSLIDTKHLVADLYNMVNVPTILWIDEAGKIVRPNDVAYADNTWQQVTGLDAEIHKEKLRNWVRNGDVAFDAQRARELQSLPDKAHQQARAEFALGQWLWEQGRKVTASKHFIAAGELAPQDFTIRRGSMPMQDIDPMGPEFMTMVQQWTGEGNEWYHPLPDA